MSIPSLLFSFLLASLYGVTFYLLFSRGWVALAVYWLAALIGFALGQFLSSALAFSLLPIGSVNAIEASVTSLIVLFLVRTLWKR
jgi:hypothetical protein